MAKSIQRISDNDPYRLETIYSQPIVGPKEPIEKIEGLIWYDTNYISEDDPGPRIQLYVNGGWHIIFGGSGFVTSTISGEGGEGGSGLPEVWIGVNPPPADSYVVWINPEGDSITPMNVERGGTGLSTIPLNYLLVGNGTSNMTTIPLSNFVQTTRTINSYALSSDITLNSDDVAAMGLGGVTEIPSNSNLNSYTTQGSYKCISQTIAPTLSNCPTKLSFHMYVTAVGATGTPASIIQTLIVYQGVLTWQRHYTFSDNTWTSWALMSTRYGGIITNNEIAQFGTDTYPVYVSGEKIFLINQNNLSTNVSPASDVMFALHSILPNYSTFEINWTGQQYSESSYGGYRFGNLGAAMPSTDYFRVTFHKYQTGTYVTAYAYKTNNTVPMYIAQIYHVGTGGGNYSDGWSGWVQIN